MLSLLRRVSSQPRRRLTRFSLTGLDALEDRILLSAIVVTSTSGGDGEGTLRWAVNQANANPGFDVIEFEGVSGSIWVLEPLEITEDVLVKGPGTRVLEVALGAPAEQLSTFIVESGATAEFHDLTMSGSLDSRWHGRAMRNDGTVILERIATRGVLSSSGRGGAIYNTGSLTIVDSNLRGRATHGGAIYVQSGTVGIYNTTIGLASTNVPAPGERAGGAIYVNSGQVQIVNSTLAGNSSSSGTGGALFIEDGSNVLLRNSILAGNLPDEIAGTVDPNSASNLIADADSSGGLAHGANGNIVGVEGSGKMPWEEIIQESSGFMALKDNGGPTDTFALIPASPAINAGSNALALGPDNEPLETDQRGEGFPRIHAGTVDIGSYEFQSFADFALFQHDTGRWHVGLSDGDSFNAIGGGTTWSSEPTWHVYSGDFTGNGVLDVLGRQAENGQWWAGLSEPIGNKLTTTSFGKWGSDASAGWQHVQVGDINGNGIDDVIGMTATGQWWAAVSDGTRFTNQFLGRWNPDGWGHVELADFTGDGQADLLGFHEATGQWWLASLNGQRLQTRFVGQWNAAAGWDDFLTGDFTGDGKQDLIARTSDNSWYFVSLDTDTDRLQTFFSGRTADPAFGFPVIGDFDGDGRDDLAVANQRGEIWIKLSTGDGMTGTQFWGRLPNGGFEEVIGPVLVGDFSGNTRDDLAFLSREDSSFWQDSSAWRWQMLISTGSSFATEGATWGGFTTRRGENEHTFFAGEFGA